MHWTVSRWLRLSVLWLGLSMIWSALLSIVVPKQVDLYAPEAWRGTCLGLVLALGGLGAAGTQILAGYRSDRSRNPYGKRRPYIVIGVALGSLGLVGLALARGPLQMFLAFLWIQVTLNVANGPYQALMPDLVPREKHGLGSTWMGLFQHIGQAAGPALAGVLLMRPQGLSTLAWCMVGLLLPLTAVTVLGIKEPVPQGQPNEGLRAAFRINLRPYPDFTWLLVSRCLLNMGFYSAMYFLLFYVRYSLKAPHPETATAGLMAVMVIAGVIGGIPVGPLADRYSKIGLCFACNTLVAVGAVGLLFCQDIRQAQGAGVLLGLGFGAFMVVDWSLMCSLIPSNSAQYMGVWNLTTVIPQVMAPLMAGPISDALARSMGQDVAYRAVLLLVLVYLVLGLRPLTWIREETLHH